MKVYAVICTEGINGFMPLDGREKEEKHHQKIRQFLKKNKKIINDKIIGYKIVKAERFDIQKEQKTKMFPVE
jgi:hypothetical protein